MWIALKHGRTSFKSTKLLNFQYPTKQQRTIPFVQTGIPWTLPTPSWHDCNNPEMFVPSAREGQQQRLDDTWCTFLRQERGSNNGSMIPGAPSYVKRGATTTVRQYRVHLLTLREGQQQRLDNTWLVHLLSYIKRGAATTARQQYLAGWCTFLCQEERGSNCNNGSTMCGRGWRQRHVVLLWTTTTQRLFNEKVCVEHERYCIEESGILWNRTLIL